MNDTKAARTYPEFLDHMGKLLQASMPRTDRERDELFAAEAEVRRLKAQLAVAEERESLARERYTRERAVLREMFDTWKGEYSKSRPSVPWPTREEFAAMSSDEVNAFLASRGLDVRVRPSEPETGK